MNKKGLSTIVATVILVAISLIVIGIIWAVISTLIYQRTEQIKTLGTCIDYNYRIMSACMNSFSELELSLRNEGRYSSKIQIVGNFSKGSFSWMWGDSRCSDIRLKEQTYGTYIPLLQSLRTERYHINISDLGEVSEIELFPVLDKQTCSPVKFTRISQCKNE